jgi:hypothetical protein
MLASSRCAFRRDSAFPPPGEQRAAIGEAQREKGTSVLEYASASHCHRSRRGGYPADRGKFREPLAAAFLTRLPGDHAEGAWGASEEELVGAAPSAAVCVASLACASTASW